MEERISALERANRHLRLAVVVLFALTVVRLIVPASAQQTPDVVRAGKFEVVRGGRSVAYLGSTEYGGSLDIRNNSNKIVGAFDADDSGAGILKVGNKAEQAIGIIGVDNDSSYLKIGIGDGNALVRLFADTGGGNLNLDAPGGADAIWMRARSGSEPAINMMRGCVNILSVRGMKFTSCP